MAGATEHSRGGTSGSVRPGALSALLKELAAAPLSVSESGDWDSGLRTGAVIGRFELVRELGRGGFGVVWEAKDNELGRRVAFKAVRAGARRHLREERLLREAEAAAQLSHPNIVTLHDLGRSDNGPYLVLEMLEGKTLAERLGEGGLTPREAVHVGAEVARGLAHAHGHGVVHRDLKPENVFLCRDGQVKLLDFGLAHAFGHRRQAGGTSGYTAPEQVEGAPEDERTDVWALGVMLFEMLSGRRPFAEEGALRKPAPALEVPALPGLGELVTRMLAARPVDRPRDAGEVLEALAAIEQEVSRASAPVAGEVRTRRRTRVPRGALVMAGIVLGAFIATVGWWAHARRTLRADASAPIALAVLPLANLSGDDAQDYFSDGMTEEITGKLSRLGGLTVTPRSSVKKYKGTSKDAREIGNELRVAYLVEGSVRRAGDRIRVSVTLVNTVDAVQLWSDILDARLDDVFQVQEQVATRIVEALHVRLSPDEVASLRRWGTRNAAAYDEFLRGEALADRLSVREKLEAARRHFERALQMDSSFAPAMAGLAFVEGTIYRIFDATPDRLTKARALLDRALAIDPKLPRALISSGLMRALAYDYRGAAEDFRRALVVEPRNFGFGASCAGRSAARTRRSWPRPRRHAGVRSSSTRATRRPTTTSPVSSFSRGASRRRSRRSSTSRSSPPIRTSSPWAVSGSTWAPAAHGRRSPPWRSCGGSSANRPSPGPGTRRRSRRPVISTVRSLRSRKPSERATGTWPSCKEIPSSSRYAATGASRSSWPSTGSRHCRALRVSQPDRTGDQRTRGTVHRRAR